MVLVPRVAREHITAQFIKARDNSDIGANAMLLFELFGSGQGFAQDGTRARPLHGGSIGGA